MRKEEKKPERDRERVSQHYCHRVTHSGHSVSPSVCVGPGRLAGDTLTLRPSLSPLFQLIHRHVFSLIRGRIFFSFYDMPRGFSSCSLHHCSLHRCSPSQPFLPASHIGRGPRLLGVLFSRSKPSHYPDPRVKDVFPKHRRRETKKQAETKAS